jgi:hypothetical protein
MGWKLIYYRSRHRPSIRLTQGVVPLLILRHNGKQVQQLRNVQVRSMSTHFQESRVENFLEDSIRQVTVFKYEASK